MDGTRWCKVVPPRCDVNVGWKKSIELVRFNPHSSTQTWNSTYLHQLNAKELRHHLEYWWYIYIYIQATWYECVKVKMDDAYFNRQFYWGNLIVNSGILGLPCFQTNTLPLVIFHVISYGKSHCLMCKFRLISHKRDRFPWVRKVASVY